MGEDTLPDIARRFNLGYEEIARANPGVDPWVPGEGREIVLPTQFVLPAAPREGLVINLAQLRVFYFPKVKEGEPQTVITHPIGIGKVGWQTPEGSTKVTGKRTNPTWFPPASVRKEHKEAGDPLPSKVPPGPDNPLGAHMMTLGWPSYLIHGTNKPYGVGLRSSHGCIRFYPEDIARAVRQDSGRHEGDGRQSAVRVRLARRRAVRAGVPGDGRRSARASEGRRHAAERRDLRRDVAEGEAARRRGRSGARERSGRRSRAASRCRFRSRR